MQPLHPASNQELKRAGENLENQEKRPRTVTPPAAAMQPVNQAATRAIGNAVSAAADALNIQPILVKITADHSRQLTEKETIQLIQTTEFFRIMVGSNFKKDSITFEGSPARFDRFMQLAGKNPLAKLTLEEWVDLYRDAHFYGLDHIDYLFDLLHTDMVQYSAQRVADFLSLQSLFEKLPEGKKQDSIRRLWLIRREEILSEVLLAANTTPVTKSLFEAVNIYEKTLKPDQAWMQVTSLIVTRDTAPCVKGIKQLLNLKKLYFQNFKNSVDWINSLPNLVELDFVSYAKKPTIISSNVKSNSVKILHTYYGAMDFYLYDIYKRFPNLEQLYLFSERDRWRDFVRTFPPEKNIHFQIYVNGILIAPKGGVVPHARGDTEMPVAPPQVQPPHVGGWWPQIPAAAQLIFQHQQFLQQQAAPQLPQHPNPDPNPNS